MRAIMTQRTQAQSRSNINKAEKRRRSEFSALSRKVEPTYLAKADSIMYTELTKQKSLLGTSDFLHALSPLLFPFVLTLQGSLDLLLCSQVRFSI